MRVLVTRPMPAAERTAAELARRGHEPVLLPLMRAEHRLDRLREGPAPQTFALVLTSGEAIRALAELSQDERRSYLDLPLFAVGETTATAARDLGFAMVEAGGGDGAALARHLLSSPNLDPSRPVLYLAGNPRSPELEQHLVNSSRRVEVVECYRMLPIPRETEELVKVLTPAPHGVLLYSSETARQFAAIVESTEIASTLKNTRFLCLSHKIAAALPEEFQARAIWPMEPREDFLLDLI
jgi:uroporphyrinogen-III synthase